MIKVAVFNNYLSTWGGGERSTFAVASSMAALGFDVEVVSFEEKLPTPAEIEDFFGAGHSGFALRSLAGSGESTDEKLSEYLADKTIFINHCAGNSFPNPCPMGVYFVMFPFQDGGAWARTYQHFVCNSEFTQVYTRHQWGADLSTVVVHPAAEDWTPAPAQRAQDILAIGRFNWGGHVKNQDTLVEAFADIFDLLPKGWRLVLLGKLNPEPANGRQFHELQRKCRRLPVVFETNVSERRKRELLGRASIFWHGTGVGKSEPVEAGQMEHFGIAIVEAMRAGVVPLCYYRGGPREIVEHSRSGFLYRDVEELKTFTLTLVARRNFLEAMRARAIERAALFTRGEFDRKLGSFVRSVVAV
jgi:glycosyltransferase involved in cell wall biosynthesis